MKITMVRAKPQAPSNSIENLVTVNQNILYRADCKEALQKLIDKGVKVDLVYLDPPFNSNRVYNMIYKGKGKTAQQKAFSDMWSYTSQTKQMLRHFKENLEMQGGVSDILKNFLRIWIESVERMASKDKKLLAYLIYMAERLVLMRQIMKDTGSLYYHCDPTASHYIKIIMDGIFGSENFRNEIVWCYKEREMSKTHYNKKHDILLFYSKTIHFYFAWQRIAEPYSEVTLKKFKYKDQKGLYQIRGKGIKGSPVYKADGLSPQHEEKYPDLVYRQYIGAGVPPRDWLYIPIINKASKERLGYPTQKPLALLNRIIKASCPENGLVLDPFCGCGTTLHSAIQNKRKWIGIDISPLAIKVIKERIQNNCLGQEQAGYAELDGSPESKNAYDKLNPFQKQDFLIRKVGGLPNEKHSGDGGVDGEMTIHLGCDKKGDDIWGKMIFSVKTGKQASPAMLRELWGTMEKEKAFMAGLILEEEPSDQMEETAERKGEFKYLWKDDMPPNSYQKIQILTAQEIIDGNAFDTPPTMLQIREYRKNPELF